MNFTSAGIVLKTWDYGESDRIVSVFTHSHGRVSAFVAGAQRSKKRAAQALDLFCQLRGEFQVGRAKNSTLLRLKTFQYHDTGIGLRNDLGHILAATYLLEGLQKLTAPFDPHPDAFVLITDALQHLEKGPKLATQVTAAITLLKLMQQLGFLPDLNRCIQCGTELSGEQPQVQAKFIAALGGIGCGRCPGTIIQSPPLPVALTKVLQQTLDRNIPLLRIQLQPRLNLELHTMALDLAEHFCGVEMKCRRHLALWLKDGGGV